MSSKELVQFTKDLLKIPSVTPDTKDAFDFVEEYLNNAGFLCRRMPMQNEDGLKIDNLYAKIGSGSPHIMFAGHLDVVPTGDESKWSFPPFEAEEKDGVIYARGAVDMKSGVTSFIHAAKRYVKDNPNFNGSISFLLAGDEEVPVIAGSKVMLEQLSAEGEKWDFAVVGEPSSTSRLGDAIKVGRRGILRAYVESFGVLGHTAYSHLADNAAHNLNNLCHKIINHKLDNGNEYFQESSIQMASFDVGNKAANIIPDYAKAVFDIRFSSDHTESSIRNVINKMSEEVKGNFKIEYKFLGDAFLTKKSEYKDKLNSVITKNTGLVAEEVTTGGSSDGRFIKDYCPIVEFGLLNKTLHKVDENVPVSDLIKLEQIYYDFLRECF